MRFYRFRPKKELFQSLADPPKHFRGDIYLKKLEELRSSKVETNKTVIIIGAGIAGLCAGYELKKLGVKVLLLEALPDHIGGRLRTLRKDGLQVELGAMRIPKSHTLTRKYISECSLTLRPFVQDNPETYCHFRNSSFRRSDEAIELSKSLFLLSEDEKKKDLLQLWEQAVLSLVNQMTEVEKADIFNIHPETEVVKELDRSSLYDAFKKANFSEEATEYVLAHFGLETYLHTSLAEHIREELEEVWNPMGYGEIAEGTDSLAYKIFSHLKDETVTSAKVFRIEQDQDAATVYYLDQSGRSIEVKGDWVICTAPLGVLSKMDIKGAFSEQKVRAIRRINYDSSTKIVALTRNRFWELNDKIYGGGSIYDGPAGHTWYPSDNNILRDTKKSELPAFLLASYTWGQQAQRVDAIPEKDLKSFVLGELRKIHPYLKDDDVLDVIRWSWSNFPWSAGAFAFFNPGEHQFLYQELTTPEGKVLLAGEHCSLTHSWMQGAFESSIDSCTYIIKHL